jgi:hypothetical protein
MNIWPPRTVDEVVAEWIAVATKFKADSRAPNGHEEDFPCRRERPR